LPLLPRAKNPCCRDGYCTKDNGHRGRCNLQHRPREDDVMLLVARVRALHVETARVRADRDHLQVEVTSCWGKFAQACAFLDDHVRSKRATRSRAITSAGEVEREIRRLALDFLESESAEKVDAPTADGKIASVQPAVLADVDVAERTTVELVPFVLIAGDRTLPADAQAVATQPASF